MMDTISTWTGPPLDLGVPILLLLLIYIRNPLSILHTQAII